MIRRVAFRKALLAGASGALAWEAVVRALLLAGVPLFDIVRLLGTMMLGSVPAALWWPAGMALHAAVGAIWAVFYAYFFWSTLDWPPAAQGAAFALLPTLLAGLVMVPQIGTMHPLVLEGRLHAPALFAFDEGWGGPAGLALGHLAYGLVLGQLYTHPVGCRVRRRAVAHG
jgi:hypothetical protein